MKNKRGVAEGIDWILGVGIFILSITFIFILFKPGVKPLHDQETLLNIVQDGIEGEALWSITEVPIFISPIYDEDVGESGTSNIVFLSDNRYNAAGAEDARVPENDDYEKLSDFIGGNGAENIKLFYVLRYSEERGEEDFPLGGYDVEPFEEIEDAEGGYENEVERFCGEDLPEGRREFSDEFCEPDVGRGVRDEYGPGRSDFGRARNELIIYRDRRTEENEPYSSIERENELTFLLHPSYQISDEIAISGIIAIPAYLDPGRAKTKYILTITDRPINFAVDELSISSPFVGCFAYGGVFDAPHRNEDIVYENLAPDACRAVYELGAKKSTSGLHLPSVLALKNFNEGDNCETGYGCMKQKWKFPELREFMVEVETIPESSAGEECDDTQQLCYKFPENKPGPPLNINTFVRQFNSFLITDDGVKIPIIVRITIW